MDIYTYRHFESDVERLYVHFLELKRSQSPAELLRCLHCLFIDGTEYFDAEILTVLYRISLSKWADQEFSNILNRCCYILINHWWLQAEFQEAASELIVLFTATSKTPARWEATQHLRRLVKQFTQTEQYAMLRRRAQVVDRQSHPDPDDKRQRIGNLIHRYPSLYPFCLLEWDSSDTGQSVVKQLQAQQEQAFEQDLLRYATDRWLCAHNPQRVSAPNLENPTLLSPEQLDTSIYQFAGKIEGTSSYRDSARQFLIELSQVQTYQDGKRQMYDYLTSAIDFSCNPKFGRHHFNQWLGDQLRDTLPQSDHLKPSGFLLVQTCGQLLDILVATPSRPNYHLRFVDLINNLGAAFTIGLMLKIVLLCRTVKSNLESVRFHLCRRFALMFKHYENDARSSTEWLVECLDNLTVAQTIHFGQEDYTKWTNLVMQRPANGSLR